MGIGKDGRIAIGSTVGHRDGNTGLQSLTVDDNVVPGHGPSEATIWAEEPHKLLHSCRNQTEVVPEMLLEILVLGQVIADSAEHKRGRDHADYQALSNASTVVGNIVSSIHCKYTTPCAADNDGWNHGSSHKMHLLQGLPISPFLE